MAYHDIWKKRRSNVFISNYEKIREIAQTSSVTASIAARMFMFDDCLRDRTTVERIDKDLNEWDALCQHYATHPTLTLKDMWDDIEKGELDI